VVVVVSRRSPLTPANAVRGEDVLTASEIDGGGGIDGVN
jgi:hypothetical protein